MNVCGNAELVIVQHLSSSRYLSGSVSSELALWMKFNGEIASILLWRGTIVPAVSETWYWHATHRQRPCFNIA
jgi:hypothetical protein